MRENTIDVANQLLSENAKLTAEVSRLNEQVRALAEFKNKVRHLLKMGELAEDFAVFLNIENAFRRSSCLDVVERLFFTREVPDEDYPGELCEECNLCWGKSPYEYATDFAGELNDVRARAVDGAIKEVHAGGDITQAIYILEVYSDSLRKGGKL